MDTINHEHAVSKCCMQTDQFIVDVLSCPACFQTSRVANDYMNYTSRNMAAMKTKSRNTETICVGGVVVTSLDFNMLG